MIIYSSITRSWLEKALHPFIKLKQRDYSNFSVINVQDNDNSMTDIDDSDKDGERSDMKKLKARKRGSASKQIDFNDVGRIFDYVSKCLSIELIECQFDINELIKIETVWLWLIYKWHFSSIFGTFSLCVSDIVQYSFELILAMTSVNATLGSILKVFITETEVITSNWLIDNITKHNSTKQTYKMSHILQSEQIRFPLSIKILYTYQIAKTYVEYSNKLYYRLVLLSQ